VTDATGGSDETLCRKIAAGDEAAFDLLVARYQGRAYRLAWSLLRDAEDARDLSQEAFIRVWQSASRFRGDARFSTWFYRILVNLCLDHRRRRRWWVARLVRDEQPDADAPLAERQPTTEPDAEVRVTDAQELTRLWDAVDRLPARQRAAVVLHVQEGLSTSDVAEVLGCAETTVRVHLHRAVAALRKSVAR
jgi:RNA polymerase sigma-70 factor, ECF subfamily